MSPPAVGARVPSTTRATTNRHLKAQNEALTRQIKNASPAVKKNGLPAVLDANTDSQTHDQKHLAWVNGEWQTNTGYSLLS